MNKDKELISDDGVVEKTDPCGSVVIGCCGIITIVLIVLGALAIINI